ncbi:SH3 domain-containing protein [Corticibacterium sp. UT-5YL-CI-8]|nr:SH3 domain-containing protein [Tianweitania sp. UT-5YL-CI-8]
MNGVIKTGVAVVLASTVGFFAAQADASAFVAWKIKDVAFGDTLNIRKFPASTSQKQAAYPNGAVLQMTGKCTGGVDLFDISGMPAWKQRQQVRYSWCQVWHDPARNGDFVTGWVYGKFIAPR